MTDAELVAQALRDIANEQQDRRLDLVLHKIADRLDVLRMNNDEEIARERREHATRLTNRNRD